MGTEGSLPSSQGPAADPYSEPDASSTHFLTNCYAAIDYSHWLNVGLLYG
jgi:hypothetical protein